MKAFRKYWITLLAGLLIVAAIAFSKDLFAQTSLQTIFHILTDAFFVAGVLITAAGLLILSSNEGTFDMLSYGMSSFVDMFRKTSQKKYKDFYDYRESRTGKKVKFGFLLICGTVYLAISFIMYFLYRRFS